MANPSEHPSYVAFKKVFGQEKNKEILIEFLNDLLEGPDLVYLLEANYISSDLVDDPSHAVMVQCLDQYKRSYVIEIHLIKDIKEKREPSSELAYQRTEEMYERDGKKVWYVFISILEFAILPGDNGRVKIDFTAPRIEDEDNPIEVFRGITMELPKFEKQVWELSSKLDHWYYFLRYGLPESRKDYPKAVRVYPMLRRAYEALLE
ncbi:MAG: PD-(D/E)XK nuclease family transposase [Bacteroidota bacterium]